MIKIYGRKEAERELLDFLVEFPRLRVFINYPIKGQTRKVRGTLLYRVHNYKMK